MKEEEKKLKKANVRVTKIKEKKKRKVGKEKEGHE
jgi:hypothetical protein